MLSPHWWPAATDAILCLAYVKVSEVDVPAHTGDIRAIALFALLPLHFLAISF